MSKLWLEARLAWLAVGFNAMLMLIPFSLCLGQNSSDALNRGERQLVKKLLNPLERSTHDSEPNRNLIYVNDTLGASETLIVAGSEWSYNDQGLNLHSSWNLPIFDDSLWQKGNAELGFGDGDEITKVAGGRTTYYFRKKFNVTDPSKHQMLVMSLIRDDGIVVYINGKEVVRDNMPDGAIGYNTYANNAVYGPSEKSWKKLFLSPSCLVAGNNVIAAEVHQVDSNSSDISFNLMLGTTSAENQSRNIELVRGPYLQQSSETGIVIRWRTTIPTGSVVRFGKSPYKLNEKVSKSVKATDHEIELTGLEPDTRYYYSIETEGKALQKSSENYFYTHPLKGSTNPLRIWVLGDAGTNKPEQNQVRDAYYKYTAGTHTNLLLLLGDNVYDSGTDQEFQDKFFHNHYEDILKRTPVYPCPGNHDLYSANSITQTGPYYDIFTLPKNGESGGVASGSEAFYSFDYGNVHFISLDSETQELRNSDGPMVKWLKKDLAANKQKWTMVYFHHPPYSKGAHNSDWQINSIEMRARVLPILDEYGVDLVLCGHTHVYERSYLLKGHYGDSNSIVDSMIISNELGGFNKPFVKKGENQKGAIYVNAGVSGSLKPPFEGWPHKANIKYTAMEFGSLVVDVFGDTMDVKFITNHNIVWDGFRIVKETENPNNYMINERK